MCRSIWHFSGRSGFSGKMRQRGPFFCFFSLGGKEKKNIPVFGSGYYHRE
jgi:hypothetical protein